MRNPIYWSCWGTFGLFATFYVIKTLWWAFPYTFVNLSEKWGFWGFIFWLPEQFWWFILPTFANTEFCEPQIFAVLIDQEWLRMVFIWSSVGMWSFSFPYLLIPAGVLLEGDRRRQRSPRSSGMLWPMRKPGSWWRSGKWRRRTARLPKPWRSASMRNSRWAGAWASVWGQLF